MLKYPVDVMYNQSERRVVHTGAKSIRPPHKAHNYEKHSIWTGAVEIFEREILREWTIRRRPLLAGSGLDGFPPLDNLVAKFVSVNTVTAREIPSVLLVTGDLSRAVATWERNTLRLW